MMPANTRVGEDLLKAIWPLLPPEPPKPRGGTSRGARPPSGHHLLHPCGLRIPEDVGRLLRVEGHHPRALLHDLFVPSLLGGERPRRPERAQYSQFILISFLNRLRPLCGVLSENNTTWPREELRGEASKAGAHGSPTLTLTIMPESSCSRMWQWKR